MALLQIIPLGGVGEIGKNCSVVRQGDDLVVIDVGLSFPNEEMPGVDIVIPDFTYLRKNKQHIRGIFLTHAHEDHIGALAYLLPDLKGVPVYGTEFTLAMVRMKLEEKIDMQAVRLEKVNFGSKVKAGSMEVEFIRITHSIPESAAVAIKTEHGHVLFTGDFKFDFTPVDNKLSDLRRLAEIGEEGVVCLLSDSTNVERKGWGPSESLVADGFRKVFAEAEGRVLITTFASNIHRMQQAFQVAAETGRKVAIAGRRMEQTIELCTRLGYVKIPRGVSVPLRDITDYPNEKLVILTTGSQGEPMAALSQLSREEYSRMKIQPGDTVLYSARPIPGNEAAIWRTVNRLFRMGAKVIYESDSHVHVSGHAYQEELKMMVNLTRPFYIAPVHGEPRHQHMYSNMARAMGYPDHRIFTMIDGCPLCLDETKAWIGEPVECGRVLVDNGGAAGVSDEVLRDRTSISNDGIIIPIIALDVDQGELVGAPAIDARGFSGNPEILQAAVDLLDDSLRGLTKADLKNVDVVRHTAADVVRKFVHRKSQMRPVVAPAIVEV